MVLWYSDRVMKRPQNPALKPRRSKTVIGTRAFEAITAVEGLDLSDASKKRLKPLQADSTLTPAQRRDAVVRAYTAMSRKK
jgi:hypothetical protein